MSKEMTPNFLAYLNEVRQFQEAHQKNKVRRVKIEKVNQAWLVRFLPVGLGERNLWWIQLGQHWANKIPIYCPKCVSQDFGGDPNAECPVCEKADMLNADNDDSISSAGFKLRANLTYLTYCLVYQIDPGRGENQEMPDSEVLKPWEFQHYKSSFDELTDYFRRGLTTARPFSVLDLKNGNDFWATRTTKGTRLDRQDPGPIFDLKDPNFEKKIDQVWNAIMPPKIKIPSVRELEVFARKAEAAALEALDERSSRGGRSVSSDETEEAVERPGRRFSSGRGAASPVDEKEPETGGDDQIPGAEVAPVRSTTRSVSSRPATVAPAATPAATPVRSVGARPVLATASARPVAAASRPNRPVTAVPAATETSVDPEEDPGIAEEVVDAAPPAAEPLTEGEEGTGEEQAPEDQEEAPPARVVRPVATSNVSLRQRLMSRVKTA